MADPSNPSESALAADWITIWQSEWAAAAVDREVQEAWLRAAVQAGLMQADAAPPPRAPGDAAPGPARPVPPARASAAADAPDARVAASASIRAAASASLRDAAIADLLDRVAELERRAAANAADPAGR